MRAFGSLRSLLCIQSIYSSGKQKARTLGKIQGCFCFMSSFNTHLKLTLLCTGFDIQSTRLYISFDRLVKHSFKSKSFSKYPNSFIKYKNSHLLICTFVIICRINIFLFSHQFLYILHMIQILLYLVTILLLLNTITDTQKRGRCLQIIINYICILLFIVNLIVLSQFHLKCHNNKLHSALLLLLVVIYLPYRLYFCVYIYLRLYLYSFVSPLIDLQNIELLSAIHFLISSQTRAICGSITPLILSSRNGVLLWSVRFFVGSNNKYYLNSLIFLRSYYSKFTCRHIHLINYHIGIILFSFDTYSCYSYALYV